MAGQGSGGNVLAALCSLFVLGLGKVAKLQVLRERVPVYLVFMIIGFMVMGCSGLIIKEDDTKAQKSAKVLTRTALAPLTMFSSEVKISQIKQDEKDELKLTMLDQALREGKISEVEYLAKYQAISNQMISRKQIAAIRQ